MHPVIELDALEKTYQTGKVSVKAVRGVSLKIDKGEFVAFMGASGSGKSTIMNILGCLDRPTAGRYLLDGMDVSHLQRDELATIRNRKLGFVFQSFNLLSRTSALENVELPLLYGERRVHSRQMRERAAKALELVGLGGRMGHHPNELSGGQQQRVAIARALINEPEVLMADEPTGNLDSATGEKVENLLFNLNKQKHITLIIVTHDPDLAAKCDREIHIADGKIVAKGEIK